MRVKIVSDSASNMRSFDGIDFSTVPLKIVTSEKEYVDDASLDVDGMASDLRAYKGGKISTSCPGVGEWLEAFEDYDIVFCVTIISTLSGSYNAAMTAKQQYEEEHPGRKVYVVDSYSAGPEMKFHVAKIKELVDAGCDFDTICKEIEDYKNNHTSLVFCLESLNNLANNGRVSKAVATLAGIIGLRLIGDVSEDGQIRPVDKARGEKKATVAILNNMKRLGYNGGKVIVDHCMNEKAANALKDAILAEYKTAEVLIEKTTGLCCFYAEKGGMMIGFEF